MFDEKTEQSFGEIFGASKDYTPPMLSTHGMGDLASITIAGIKAVEGSPISKALNESCALAIGQGQSMIHIDENLKLTVLDKSKIFNGE